MTDAELLQAWNQGDANSGEQLYRRHFRLVYAFFRTKIVKDVDDLVQNTFMAAVGKAANFRGGSVRAFLLGIARYELLEYLRRTTRREARIEPMISSIYDLATGPSSELRREETHDQLRVALQSLPIDQQIALELRYWHELSMDEIAEIQEVATATVRTRLHRARDALGTMVEDTDLARMPTPSPDPG